MPITHIPYAKKVTAKNLDDAYAREYFTGSVNRNTLIEEIEKQFPELKIVSGMVNGEVRTGIWRGERFLSGVSKALFTIPRFSIMSSEDGKVIARSYLHTLQQLAKEGYEVDVEKLY